MALGEQERDFRRQRDRFGGAEPGEERHGTGFPTPVDVLGEGVNVLLARCAQRASRASVGRWRRRGRAVVSLLIYAIFGCSVAVSPHPARAENAAPSAGASVAVPNFWNPRGRGERVEAPQIGRSIRFLTDDEFPPLHFAGPDGNPTGFSVELARAICERMALSCTIQARRFDTLLDALADKQGDVVAAAIPITPDLNARFLATRPYFRWPARFVARRERGGAPLSPDALSGQKVGAIEGSAHAAYLQAFFPKVEVKDFPDLAAAQGALKRGDVDYVFADGLNLALWLGGADSEGCCAFAGGAYLENRYFGEGIGLVTRKDDVALARALDDALQRLWDEGKYTEIYLRFFPISPF